MSNLPSQALVRPKKSRKTVSVVDQLKCRLSTAQSVAVKGHLPASLHLRPYRPHALKPIPSRVLAEDDYIDMLELIIQRDFFPDLPLLWMQAHIADGKKQGKPPSELDQLQTTLHALQEARKETRPAPLIRQVLLQDGRELSVDVSRLTLSEFQSLFTSEDNASFEKIVQQEKRKLAAEQAWMEKSAVTHNVDVDALRAAIDRRERPAQLLYGPTDARNALMFPLTDETAGIMGLYPGEKDGDVMALCLPAPSQAYPQGEVVPQNTRLNDEEQLLSSMYTEQVAKQVRVDQRAADDALFDTMVEKGIYSAKAIANLTTLKGPLQHHKQPERVSAASLRSFHESINGPITPMHNGFTLLHTPAHEGYAQHQEGATPLPHAQAPRFHIPDLSQKELAAQRLTDRVSRKMATHKSRNKTSCLREVLQGTTTPLAMSKYPKDLFGHSRLSGVNMLRQRSSIQRTPHGSLLCTPAKSLQLPLSVQRHRATPHGFTPQATKRQAFANPNLSCVPSSNPSVRSSPFVPSSPHQSPGPVSAEVSQTKRRGSGASHAPVAHTVKPQMVHSSNLRTLTDNLLKF